MGNPTGNGLCVGYARWTVNPLFLAELTWCVVYVDPAAPVSQSAQEMQELDKTATPPPQETPAIQGLQEGQFVCCSNVVHAFFTVSTNFLDAIVHTFLAYRGLHHAYTFQHDIFPKRRVMQASSFGNRLLNAQ